MPSADQEAFLDFREDLNNLFRHQSSAVIIVQDPDNMILPTEYFLGGQLKTDNNIIKNFSFIRAYAGKRQLTNLTFGHDEYMMTDEKIFDVKDPDSQLSDEKMDDLSMSFRNKNIIWTSDQSAIVVREFMERGVSIFAKRDEYLRSKLGEIQPTDPEVSKIEEYLIDEAIKTDINGLMLDYETILEVVPSDDQAGTRKEIILGGSVPSSVEWPKDYIDITLVYSMFNMHVMTTVVVGGGKYEISDDGVVTLSDIPHHRLTGEDLLALSFLLKQRDPIAVYSRENTVRLADAWRQSKPAPPVET